MQEALSLWGLFISSFLAATLLPGGSEAVLFAVLDSSADLLWPALFAATLGNTLGGLTSYGIGRMFPQRRTDPDSRTGRWQTRALVWTRRFGPAVMLGAWIPIIGDPLCVAAGWLRLNVGLVTLFMAIGKLARYLVIAWAVV